MADLVETIHMAYEQITLDDDTQMNIKLAASMMLRLYSLVRSDADTALALLQIGTKCQSLDPEYFGEKAIEVDIAPPNLCPGHARAWLYGELMATEDAKDQAYIRGKRKEPRVSGTNLNPPKRGPNREAARDVRIKNGTAPSVLHGKKPYPKKEPPPSSKQGGGKIVPRASGPAEGESVNITGAPIADPPPIPKAARASGLTNDDRSQWLTNGPLGTRDLDKSF